MDWNRWWRRVHRLPVGVGRKQHLFSGCYSPFPLVLSLLLVVLLACFIILEGRLRPVIATLAKVEVESRFTEVIDSAILSDLTQRGTGYEDFVTIERDGDGSIRALTTNMAAMNLLRSQLENDVFMALGEVDISTISIPLGSLTGLELLWGRGPDITARSISVGVLNSEFISEFTSAGINQTSHRIYLDIRAPLTIMMAGGTVETEVSTHLCVAETIIVGSVPSSYLQLQ